MLSKIKIIFTVLIASSLFFGLAKAASQQLPEPMVGSTSITFANGRSLNLPDTGSYARFNDISGLGNSDLVVMAWVKLTGTIGSNTTIIGTGPSNGSAKVSDNCANSAGVTEWSLGFVQQNPYPNVAMQMNFCDGSGRTPTTTIPTPVFTWPSDNQFHLITYALQSSSPTACGTYASPCSHYQFFFDGAQKGTEQTTKKPVGNINTIGNLYSLSNPYIYVGASSGGFPGDVDAVRIFDHITVPDILTYPGNNTILGAVQTVMNSPECPNSSIGSMRSEAFWNFNGADNASNGIVKLGANAKVNGPNVVTTGDTRYFGFAANEVMLNYQDSTGSYQNPSGQPINKTDAPSLKLDGITGLVSIPETSGSSGNTFVTGDLDLSFWFKQDATDDGGYLVSKAWNGQGNYNYYINATSGVMKFCLGSQCTTPLQISKSYSTGVWNFVDAHAKATKNTTTGGYNFTLNLSINKQAAATVNKSETATENTSTSSRVVTKTYADGTVELDCAAGATKVAIPYSQGISDCNGTTPNRIAPGSDDLITNHFPLVLGDIFDYGNGHADFSSNMFKGNIDDFQLRQNNNLVYNYDFSESFNPPTAPSTAQAVDKSGAGNNGIIYQGASSAANDGPIADANSNKNNGYDLFGFDKNDALACIPAIITGNPNNCFTLNSSSANMYIMNSRTSTNGTSLIETATLLTPSKPLIIGDAYLGSSDPNNFAYWGRNLTQSGPGTSASSNSFWGLGNYTMNPDSQSTLSGTSYTQYTNKISELAAQATPITASQLESNTQWYLQAGSANTFGTDSSETDTNKYPEGKIWVCSDYVVLNNNPITIHGKGTIILTGATINPTKYDSTNNVYYYPLLDVYSGTKIVKANPNGDSDTLGIIAYNQNQANKEPYIWFAGNNEIHAAVFSSVTFSDGPVGSSTSNSKFYGSFVAPKFSFSTNNDDQFYYDYKFDNNWPPGFRYLNMPRPKESN